MIPTLRRPLASGFLLAACGLAMLAAPADGQILKRLKKVVGNAAESEAMNQVDRMVRGKVRCVFDDLACIRGAEASGKGAVLTTDDGEILLDDEGRPVSDPEAGAAIATAGDSMQQPGQGVWANYDFQPGDDILFLDDFSADKVGDFPRRFELVEGSFEIVEWQSRRYIRAHSGGLIAIPLPATLPERFTVEYSVSLTHGNAYARLLPGRSYHGRGRNYAGSVVSIEYGRAGIRAVGKGPEVLAHVESGATKDVVLPVRVMADGGHLKVYLGERRVANAPNAVFPRTDTLFLAVGSATESHPILIGPVRIAGGGRDLYDRLVRDSRVSTQGILFASGSARIRPESTPTLLEIGRMLRDHPELRLGIEGHTDADGDDAANQDLSERRAAAVRDHLVSRMGIDAARLEPAGFGESKPVADNGTPEGKQQNRRVELVRLS